MIDENEMKQANPEKARLVSQITTAHYNARKHGAEGTFTAKEWLALCDYYSNKCLRCGKQVPLTIDHVVPPSKGGSNYISNLQPLCLSCNSRKHRQTTDYRPTVPAWAKVNQWSIREVKQRSAHLGEQKTNIAALAVVWGKTELELLTQLQATAAIAGDNDLLKMIRELLDEYKQAA